MKDKFTIALGILLAVAVFVVMFWVIYACYTAVQIEHNKTYNNYNQNLINFLYNQEKAKTLTGRMKTGGLKLEAYNFLVIYGGGNALENRYTRNVRADYWEPLNSPTAISY